MLTRLLFRVGPAILLLAVLQLALSILTVAPAALALSTYLGRRLALNDVARGDWLNVALDFTAELAASPTGPAVAGASAYTAAAVVLGLAAVPLHALLYTFVSGATLGLLADPKARVLPAGKRWFWPMLRLGLLLLPAAVVLIIALQLLLSLVSMDAVFALAIRLAVLGALGSVFELARAIMIYDSSRSALFGLWRAVVFAVQRPLPIFGTWLGLGLGNLVILGAIAVLTLATTASEPVGATVVMLVTVMLGAGYKIFRLVMQHLLVRRRAEHVID